MHDGHTLSVEPSTDLQIGRGSLKDKGETQQDFVQRVYRYNKEV